MTRVLFGFTEWKLTVNDPIWPIILFSPAGAHYQNQHSKYQKTQNHWRVGCLWTGDVCKLFCLHVRVLHPGWPHPRRNCVSGQLICRRIPWCLDYVCTFNRFCKFQSFSCPTPYNFHLGHFKKSWLARWATDFRPDEKQKNGRNWISSFDRRIRK